MGRSVSTHSRAVATVFLHDIIEDDEDSQVAWADFLDDLRDNVLGEKYPSLAKCDRWEGRENHVIAENSQVEVSVSEYCGLVAVCLAPRDNDYRNQEFHQAVAERIAASFEKYLNKAFRKNTLRSNGFMSNGGQVFTKV